MFGIDNYNPPGWRRNNLPFFFMESNLDPNQTDIYEFGVFLGGSIVTIFQSMRDALGRTNRVVGFDSWEGIPPELYEPIYEGAWAADKKGDLNQTFHPARWVNFENPDQVRDMVHNFIITETGGNLDLDLVRGWYDEVLTSALATDLRLKPAYYIDFDADIYSSTIQAYDFLFENELIVPGTIIGYDDWGGAPNHWDALRPVLGGECRAHFEAVEKYKMRGKMHEFDYEMGRQQRCIFVVEGFG
jgi:hypothetical protein